MKGPEGLRFSTQNIGRNAIAKYLPDMIELARIKGRFTGHSAKVSCATQLYEMGYDEQLIKERTGHRSDAMHAYKHTPGKQQVDVSLALYLPSGPALHAFSYLQARVLHLRSIAAQQGRNDRRADKEGEKSASMVDEGTSKLFSSVNLSHCTFNIHLN